MIFRKVDKYHGVSDCRRYVINRVTVNGDGVYTAVRMSSMPSQQLHHARFGAGDEERRAAAWRECVSACEQDEVAHRGE